MKTWYRALRTSDWAGGSPSSDPKHTAKTTQDSDPKYTVKTTQDSDTKYTANTTPESL